MFANDPHPHAGKSKQSLTRKTAAMTVVQALEIMRTFLNLDATLTGETVNLNRVTFLLSELRYGRMHVGTNWHHVVPAHRNVDGTVRRDIHQLAAEIVEDSYSARELVELVARPLDFTRH